jgi:hypothetical protein
MNSGTANSPLTTSYKPAVQVRVHFDRGFSERPATFYQRLNLREWLDCLDWHHAEASDRLRELEERGGSAGALARERDILRMLEDEIREADQAYCGLSFGQR